MTSRLLEHELTEGAAAVRRRVCRSPVCRRGGRIWHVVVAIRLPGRCGLGQVAAIAHSATGRDAEGRRSEFVQLAYLAAHLDTKRTRSTAASMPAASRPY